jgi:hypothetical protein
MGTLGRLVAIATASFSLLGAASAGTVQVYAAGKLRGAFQPGSEPYGTDGPSVSVYLERRDVKTADGQVVTGLEFIGWREGEGVRVQVFLLVPAIGVPNTYLPDGKAERLARRYFSSVLLAKGDQLVLSKMQELGVEPMNVRLR